MDLRVYRRVMWRFRYLVVLGTVLSLTLAVLSYSKVSFDGGGPTLTPRKLETWQAQSTLFLTQPGFPAGRSEQPVIVKKIAGEETAVPKYSDPGRFTALAGLYARLADSDEVRQRVKRSLGNVKGAYTVLPTADTSYGAVNGLPMISIFGTAETPGEALYVTQLATRTFLGYFTARQNAAEIPEEQRVQLQLLNAAGQPVLVDPRKKTLPIVVFMAGLFATIALAFVLENARPRTDLVAADAADLPSPDVRRLA
jgi:capsular polysaccharide biosynthesis protein